MKNKFSVFGILIILFALIIIMLFFVFQNKNQNRGVQNGGNNHFTVAPACSLS
jgi:competence protein ComGC